MTRDQMLAELKAKLRETVVDPAWGDPRLLAWLAEGQDEFCERTGYFVDATTYTVDLVADQISYDIPERAIQILDIWYGAKKLGKFTEADRSIKSDSWVMAYDETMTGMPSAWQVDKETGKIRFDRTPTTAEAGESLALRVWRYSLYDLDDDTAPTDPAEPEIPRRFHWAPIEWACRQALLDHDLEKQDPVKATTHERNFLDYVAKGKLHFQRFHGMDTRVGISPAYRT
jgi:hypothetical protein